MGDEIERKVPGPDRNARSWRLQAPWRGIFRRRSVHILFAVACAILLLGTSAPQPKTSSAREKTDSSAAPASPPGPFTPYLLNASEFPLPDTLLNNSTAIDPQLSVSSFDNQTIFELLFTRAPTYHGSPPAGIGLTVNYLLGRYAPAVAQCELNMTGCPANTTHLPIAWGSPSTIFALGNRTTSLATAIGSSGGLVAAAQSSNNQTQLAYAYNFGVAGTTWIRPTLKAIPGGDPRLAVSPTSIELSTVSPKGGVYATVFHIPNQPAPTTLSVGGGARQQIPTPTVSSVSPFYGAPGSTVNIYGKNFASGCSVKFGAQAAPPVTFISSTHIQATVPGPTTNGPVNVTVTVTGGGTSATDPPYDWFTVSSTAPDPEVLSVVPDHALPNTTTYIFGYGFGSTSTVSFGSAISPLTTIINSTYLATTVPWGSGGPFDTTVSSSGQTSGPTLPDRFIFSVSQAILPRADDAAPLLLSSAAGGPVYGVVASDVNTSTVTVYTSKNGGSSYSANHTASFSNSTGSAIFSQIGDTRLMLGGGVPGQVATVGYGQTIFALFTTNLDNRTLVETEGTSNGGLTWTGPFAAAPSIGSVADPYATISPAGLVYVTWLDNGAGPWEVDQSVYSESGRLLLGPQVIPGSGGSSGQSAYAATVAIDGLDRPLYAWGTAPGWDPTFGQQWVARNLVFASAGGQYVRMTSNASIMVTGGFLNASTALTELSNAFHRTVPADYLAPPNSTRLSTFQSRLNANLTLFGTDLSAKATTCKLQKLAVRTLMPNLTWVVPAPAFTAIPGGCSLPVVETPTTLVENLTGPTTANSFLGVYADWLTEAVGFGSLKEPYWAGAPDQALLLRNYTVHPPSPYYPPNRVSNVTSYAYQVSVLPEALNPNAVYFNVTGEIYSRVSEDPCHINHPFVANTTMYPVVEGETLWIYSGSWHTVFQPAGMMPSVYVTNLSSGMYGNYTLRVHVEYQQTLTTSNCAGGYRSGPTVEAVTLGPSNQTFNINGTYTTYLEGLPESFNVTDVGNVSTNGKWTAYSAWNASMLANYTWWVNGSSGTLYSNRSTAYYVNGSTGAPVYLSKSAWYNVTIQLRSVHGGYNTTGGWPIELSAGLALNSSPEVYSPPTYAPWKCTFYEPSYSSVTIDLASSGTFAYENNITTSSATLTWFSRALGTGWITYNDTLDGQFSETAERTYYPSTAGLPFSNDHYRYSVELHGLTPWSLYTVVMGVSNDSANGCLVLTNSTSRYLQVLSLFPMAEQDFPYDSITQQGGGAQFTWSIPSTFAATAKYQNGTLTYCQWSTGSSRCAANTTVEIPLPSLGINLRGSGFVYYPINTTFVLNVTGLTLNTLYNATMQLNFTFHGQPFTAFSDPLHFWYEKDTSGDGLTDWEKIHGWEVTTQSLTGSWNFPIWVTANPNLYATNGLVNDYVEKEFALNPETVDTAGSHMLDTWNLTFNLGKTSSPLTVPAPANFRYWYEQNTSGGYAYDWNATCQYFVTPCTSASQGAVATAELSNITGADSSAWASRVLWTRSALNSFVNMSGVRNASWLRAILGNTNGSWTITVEGKLSWGANPLATSTPRNGIADGAIVDPLYEENLEVSLFSASLSACPTAPSNGHGGYGSYGWAALFYVNWSTASGPHEIGGPGDPNTPAGGNFSTQTWDNSTTGTSNCGSLSGYQVLVPFNGTSQNLSVQVRVLLNQSASSSSTNLVAQKITGGASPTTFSLLYNVPEGQNLSYTPPGGTNGSVSFHLCVAPAGVRATTFLWLPTQNSTLTNLPWGLKRYTGEQAFDLIEVNANGSQSVTTPYAQNSSRSYSVTLASGLNNILVPRSQFMYSPLGQAILLGKNTSWTNASARAPLLNSATNNTLKYYGSSNPLRDLACYWQNRAINNTTSGSICGNETGTHWYTSSANVATVAATSTDGVNTGGVPGNPSLENASEEGATLQAILTLNISNTTGLRLLVAGLLDNTSGGVNGTFTLITNQVQTLGLNQVVVNALANATYSSSGFAKHVPWGVVPPPPPPPPCSGSFCWITNAVSGIVSVAGTLFSYVWSAAVALATFVDDHLPTWLKNLGAAIVSRAASALAAVGALIMTCLTILLSAIQGELVAILAPAFGPVKLADASYTNALNSSSNRAYTDTKNSGSPSPTDAASIGQALEGSIFLFGLVVSTALSVAVYAVAPVDIGPGFIAGVVLTIMVLGATTAAPSLAAELPDISYAGVRSAQAVVNLSSADSSIKDPIKWNTFALSLSIAGTTVSWGLTATMWAQASEYERLFWPSVILTIDTVVLALEWSQVFSDAPLIIVLALILSITATAFAALHLQSIPAYVWPSQILASIALIIAVIALTAALYHALTA